MTLETKQLGNLGEKIAEKYLKKKGYKILDRNFRYKRYGEIDIIATKKNNLHFIEVKTRNNNNENNIYIPENNITYFKKRQLIKLSKIYLAKKNLSDIPWQIDIIAVEINPFTRKEKIRHIEQAITDFS